MLRALMTRAQRAPSAAMNWSISAWLFGRSGVNPILSSEARKDRKSTRLNSSHLVISYAVFCLTKKMRLRNPQNPVGEIGYSARGDAGGHGHLTRALLVAPPWPLCDVVL